MNRRSVALAFLNGLFWACMPMPLQMVAASLFAILLRCNIPISVGLVFLTNPITMPPYYLAAYQLGAHVIGTEMVSWPETFSFGWLGDQFNLVWWPLLLGSLMIGVLASSVGYLVIRIWWSVQIRTQWAKRKRRAAKVPAEASHDEAQGNDPCVRQSADRE